MLKYSIVFRGSLILNEKINTLLNNKNTFLDQLNQINDTSRKRKADNNEKKEIKNQISIINSNVKYRKNNIYMVKKELKYLLSLIKSIQYFEKIITKYALLNFNNDNDLGICSNCNELINGILKYKTNVNFMVESNFEYKIL